MVLGVLPEGVSTICTVSPDGRMAAIESHNPVPIISFWQTDKIAPPVLVRAQTQDEISSLSFSADNKLLASAAGDGLVGLWNAQDGRNIGLMRAHAGEALSVAFSPDGRTLASSGDDSTIKFWNLATLQEAGSIRGHKGVISSIVFSPDGRTLASAGNRIVRFWEAPTFDEISEKQKASK
jgi:WD40 repeat protein